MTSPRSALLAGATGLVGGHVLKLLLADHDYSQVTVLTRRTLPLGAPKLVQQVADFDRLAELAPFPQADDVFCCLGTTIRRAGSQDAFYKVDFTYVHDLARLAAARGAKQLLLVSSLGANPRSRVFYNRVKGKVEDAVRALPLHGIHLFRPSLLLGARAEFRLGERIATVASRAVSWAFVGPLANYRPIAAEVVARAMVRVAKEGREGATVYESQVIQRLAAV
ncbi:MAG: NAD(P)H-binding protein [Gemmatimonadetes bacterium]|nr:NAD(P)H-binding protein [Gemmatimonadota bacterium]